MMISRQTRSCLSAVIMLLAAAIKADGFVVPTGPMVSGRTGVSASTLIESSAPAPSPASRWTTASSKLNASPYEEYMATREKKAAGVAVAPEAEEKASKFESYQASRNEQASMPPAEKEKSLFESYMASRGMSSAPEASEEAPAPAPAPESSSELSPYEAYMKSREKVNAAEAATTFEEKTKASAYEEYMAQRKAKEGGEVLDCAEEECEPEVVEQEASLFTSYMASRGIEVDAAPEIDCAEEECTPEEQVSYYDSYMASRKNVKEANADVTPQEKETVSMFDSYMSSRNKSDQARSEMPPAQAEKKLFEEYEEESPSETKSSKTPPGHKGAGGMADTRDPSPVKHSDPRKSIPPAQSFEEYLKSKKN